MNVYKIEMYELNINTIFKKKKIKLKNTPMGIRTII